MAVRFPWGSILALRYGSPSVPLDIASGAVANLRHRRIRSGCLSASPAIRVVREEQVDEAFRCRQLRSFTLWRTSETGAFSSAEDADSPWTFWVLEEPSPNRVDL